MKKPNIEEYKNEDGEIIIGLKDDIIIKQEKYIKYTEKKTKRLLNSIISCDPLVITNYKDSDLIIRDLYNQCKKLLKSYKL